HAAGVLPPAGPAARPRGSPVRNDANNNGIWDNGETGVTGATVHRLSSTGTVLRPRRRPAAAFIRSLAWPPATTACASRRPTPRPAARSSARRVAHSRRLTRTTTSTTTTTGPSPARSARPAGAPRAGAYIRAAARD